MTYSHLYKQGSCFFLVFYLLSLEVKTLISNPLLMLKWHTINIIENVFIFLKLDVIIISATNHWQICSIVNKCCMWNRIIFSQSSYWSILISSLSGRIRLFFLLSLLLPLLLLRAHIESWLVLLVVLILCSFKLTNENCEYFDSFIGSP